MLRRNLQDFIVIRLVGSAHMDAGHPGILAKLHIRQTVAHHNRRVQVDIRKILAGLQRHADIGFPAVALLRSQMRAAIDRIKSAACFLKIVLQLLVYGIHLLWGTYPLPYSLLIGNQNGAMKF